MKSVSTGRSFSAVTISKPVLRDYVRHYNQHRPHRGLRLQVPAPVSAMTSAPPSFSDVGRRDVLGGLIHEYHAAA